MQQQTNAAHHFVLVDLPRGTTHESTTACEHLCCPNAPDALLGFCTARGCKSSCEPLLVLGVCLSLVSQQYGPPFLLPTGSEGQCLARHCHARGPCHCKSPRYLKQFVLAVAVACSSPPQNIQLSRASLVFPIHESFTGKEVCLDA